MTTNFSEFTVAEQARKLATLDDEAGKGFIVFSSKAAYLGWVKTWKSEYIALAGEIRETKRRRANTALDDAIRENAQSTREILRIKARNYLRLRKLAKIVSWAQAQAQRAAA